MLTAPIEFAIARAGERRQALAAAPLLPAGAEVAPLHLRVVRLAIIEAAVQIEAVVTALIPAPIIAAVVVAPVVAIVVAPAVIIAVMVAAIFLRAGGGGRVRARGDKRGHGGDNCAFHVSAPSDTRLPISLTQELLSRAEPVLSRCVASSAKGRHCAPRAPLATP